MTGAPHLVKPALLMTVINKTHCVFRWISLAIDLIFIGCAVVTTLGTETCIGGQPDKNNEFLPSFFSWLPLMLCHILHKAKLN